MNKVFRRQDRKAIASSSSKANVESVRQRKLDFDIDVDFKRQVIAGSVDIKFSVIRETAKVVLDTSDLLIRSVRCQLKNKKGKKTRKGKLVPHTLSPLREPFGRALSIHLPRTVKPREKFTLKIVYETSPSASGIQWLEPAMTDGGQHPYLFTQFQAIHARSFVPCQDLPGSKFTYTATVRVPAPLVVVMSALRTTTRSVAGEKNEFHFVQKVPISSYLLALAVGNLVSQQVGPVSSVWAEPEQIAAAAHEFAQVNDFIEAADDITDMPYARTGWGKYDMLVLPGSFPYGGMENPSMTFLTPTLIAGDRSMVSVVAHELSHSWMGNLVSCHTWNSFFLNEGWCVWLERKIIGRLYGEKARDTAILAGQYALERSLENMKATPDALSLVTDLTGIDPDDYFSSIPYEKGSQFLLYLERAIVQDEAKFELFVQSWLRRACYGTVTAHDLKHQFIKFFRKDDDVHPRLVQIQWSAWLYARSPTGCPVDVLSLCDRSEIESAEQLAKRWTQEKSPQGDVEEMQTWSAKLKILFLDEILAHSAELSMETVEALDRAYQFSSVNHSEIRFRWLVLALKKGREASFADACKMLSTQGRMKFTRPLYKALSSTDAGRPVALELFQKIRFGYHPICRKMVAQDLGV